MDSRMRALYPWRLNKEFSSDVILKVNPDQLTPEDCWWEGNDVIEILKSMDLVLEHEINLLQKL